VGQLLREADLGPDRVQFHSLAANESHRLAHILAQVVDGIPATAAA